MFIQNVPKSCYNRKPPVKNTYSSYPIKKLLSHDVHFMFFTKDMSRLVYNSNDSLIWPLGHGRFCSHSLWNKNKTFITVKCWSFRFHDIARAIFPGFLIFAYAAFQQQQFPSLNFNFVSVDWGSRLILRVS